MLDRAVTALGELTSEIVEDQMARDPTLSDENKVFIGKIVKHFEVLSAITVDDVEGRAIRGEGFRRGGILKFRLGDLAGAELAFKHALDIRKDLAEKFPDDRGLTRKLVDSYRDYATLLRSTGRTSDAEHCLDRAVNLWNHLLKLEPQLPDYRLSWARAVADLGLVYASTGRFGKAEKAHQQALDSQLNLLTEYPTNSVYLGDVARSYYNLGILYRDLGRLADAEKAYRDSLAYRKQIVKIAPNRPRHREELAACQNNLANLLGETGRIKDAESFFSDAQSIFKSLAAEYTTRPEYRQQLATCYHNLAICYRTRNAMTESEKANNSALLLRKQLVTDFPTRQEYLEELSASYGNIASNHSLIGQHKEAIEANNEAIAILRQLAHDFPTNKLFKQNLASAYYNLGCQHMAIGPSKDAIQAFDCSLEIGRSLAQEHLLEPQGRGLVASSLVNLANIYCVKRQYEKAKDCLVEAEPHHKAAIAASPQNKSNRVNYRNQLWSFSNTYAGLGDCDNAVHAASMIRDLEGDPASNALDAARALCGCVNQVAGATIHDNELRKAQARRYTDEAMKMLQLAVNKGYRNAELLKKDNRLAVLHSRDDFKKLITDLETSKPR
ncbi:MAG: tetratricopeptide repeat protein [Planctomycetia bacterium]|nr:tetratricopeptide repeat protein [Planctomycetia bacterium]